MSARELLREVASELEAVQVIRGRADPRAAALRALAARIEAEMAFQERLAGDGNDYAEAALQVLTRLDAPLQKEPR